MLEAFFNNRKTFSVFRYLLETDYYVSEEVIASDLYMSRYEVSKILNNFDLLDMIEHISSPNTHLIKLNLDNPIVLSICILDELLEKYYMDDQKERIVENGDLQRVLKNASIENMSVLDFVECLKRINK